MTPWSEFWGLIAQVGIGLVLFGVVVLAIIFASIWWMERDW